MAINDKPNNKPKAEDPGLNTETGDLHESREPRGVYRPALAAIPPEETLDVKLIPTLKKNFIPVVLQPRAGAVVIVDHTPEVVTLRNTTKSWAVCALITAPKRAVAAATFPWKPVVKALSEQLKTPDGRKQAFSFLTDTLLRKVLT